MQAQQLMTYPALAIRSDVPSLDALVFADRHRLHHLLLRENGAIVGLVCTCDLREVDLTAPVSTGIQREPVVVLPHETSRRIAEMMRRECVGSVLVAARDGWGIVTKGDILEAGLEAREAVELIDACRCMYCGGRKHLRRHELGEFACVDCLERAHHPERFEGGEVD
jgi:signal-transduction protein with cAMP-binding, CBS, and nucleotidyltransferase domain